MAKVKRRRWGCSDADHPGVLAPGKMRKNDVRRFCWPCSEVKGVLVERSCKVNEERTQQSKERSAKKSAKRRGKVSSHRQARKDALKDFWVVEGLDLRKEIVRICSGAHAREALKSCSRPVFYLQRHGCSKSHGTAWASGRIKLWMKQDITRLSAVALIAHEIAHILDTTERGGKERGGGWGHGEDWWMHFQELIREAYGVEIDQPKEQNRWYRGVAIRASLERCRWLVEKEEPPRKPKRPRGAEPFRMRGFCMFKSKAIRLTEKQHRETFVI